MCKRGYFAFFHALFSKQIVSKSVNLISEHGRLISSDLALDPQILNTQLVQASHFRCRWE
ncbi:hypothetical protein LCGC14_1941860 [marine sediment metagenome]|uniref:Uncharacterized protein n=1 Tax=marine sediment metagenome TaxID=412755 RepID=A0A0F9G8J8_9ZZZZ